MVKQENNIKLNRQKVKNLFYSMDDKDFVGIKSFYAKKEKPEAYYGKEFVYSIIAVHKNGEENVFASYELTKDGVKSLRE